MHTLTADKQKRVRIPDAQPGQVFAYEADRGVVTLTPVQKAETAEPPPPTFRLVKEGGFTVIETDRHLSLETIKELLSEFP